MTGSRSRTRVSRSRANESGPLVVLLKITTPSPVSTSTWSPARKPGIDPPCPAYRRPSTFHTCQPRPCPDTHAWPGRSLTAWTTHISSSVSFARRSPVSPPRKAAHRARSTTVDQSCPAGAIAPASCSGSGSSRSANGWTASPTARPAARGAASCASCPGARAGRAGRRRPTRTPGPARRARPARRTRRWSSGTGSPARIRCTGDGAISAAQSPPGVRSHQGPSVSACKPEVCVSSCAIVARPNARAGYVVLEPVVEVEPTRVAQPHDAHRHEGLGDRADPVLRVGVGGHARRRARRACRGESDHTRSPPRTIPAATDGSRPSAARRRAGSRARERSTVRASPPRSGLAGRRSRRGRRPGGPGRRRLLRGRLLGRRLLSWSSSPLACGSSDPGPLLGEQLEAALGRDRLGVVVLAQRRVGLAVGDVGPEPAVLDHHRLAATPGRRRAP